ncbi:hypothetical protein FRC00_010132 [Tulasnella sp. 408]|nr:hypothetical protein FRC00_010132 [Tulasnella sp. 408]
MGRTPRGRAKTSRNVPAGSGSQSLATPPVIDDHHYVSVWDPEAAPVEASWGVTVDDWNNPQGDNTWEWEAAGDESIASDDPFKEKKLAWRKEHDHVYSSEHRVRRWRERLPVKRLLLSRVEEVENSVEVPPETELWDGQSGCRLPSRERSRSKGRQGKKERAAKAEEWRQKVEEMIAEGVPVDADSSSGSFTEEIEQWLDKLIRKPKWSHVKKSKARAFFELSMHEKVSAVERLSRQIAEGPSWDI